MSRRPWRDDARPNTCPGGTFEIITVVDAANQAGIQIINTFTRSGTARSSPEGGPRPPSAVNGLES
ncbi:MAG: hypothetical protein HZC54_13490 [Verrucomicrobia bacterium]|nr:hypothetical protein [Verrucomicrobiota bacterium]